MSKHQAPWSRRVPSCFRLPAYGSLHGPPSAELSTVGRDTGAVVPTEFTNLRIYRPAVVIVFLHLIIVHALSAEVE